LNELGLETNVAGDTAHVIVRGEIDVATAPQLREILRELIQAGVHQIVLDCRQLDFLDSSGIGLLVATRKRLGDGELVVDSPRPHVRKVLEQTGVTQELSLRPAT
jgi:anti-sigma B factor antagonist